MFRDYVLTGTYEQTLPYRRLLLVSTLAHAAYMVVGGLSLLVLTDTLVIACGLLAWRGREAGHWLRTPVLVALGLVVLQVLLSIVALWVPLTALALLMNPGITALILACLLIPIIVPSIADQREVDFSSILSRSWWEDIPRYDLSVAGTLLATWLLLIVTALVTADRAASLYYYPVLVLAVGLMGWVLRQTWQTRRRYPMTPGTAVLAGVFLLAQLCLEAMHLIAGTPTPANPLVLTVGAWGTLVVLAMLVVRQPVPQGEAPAAPQHAAAQEQTANSGA